MKPILKTAALTLFAFAVSMVVLSTRVSAATTPHISFTTDQRFEENEMDIRSSVINAGKLYEYGNFKGSVDFNAGVGTDIKNSPSFYSLFVRVTNLDGSYVKTLVMTGTDSAYPTKIVLSPDGNEYYLLGLFRGDMDFDAGAGTAYKTTVSDNGMGFAAVYDSSDDSFSDVYVMTATDVDSQSVFNALVFDSNGNRYFAGSFEGTDVDLDPSIDSDEFSSNSRTSFVSKFDDEMTYQQSFINTADSSEVDTEVYSMAIDSDDQLYYSLYISANEDSEVTSTVNLDPTGGTDNLDINLSPYGYVNAIIKLGDDGSYLDGYALENITASSDYGQGIYIADMLIDSNDDIYVTGNFSGYSDINPVRGLGDIAPVDGNGIYVMKLNTDGTGIFADVQNYPDYVDAYPYQMAFDSNENVYIMGQIFGDSESPRNYDFDITDGVDNKSVTDRQVFLTRINSDGSYGYSIVSASNNSDPGFVGAYPEAIALDSSDNIYLSNFNYWFFSIQTNDEGECTSNYQTYNGSSTTKFASDGSIELADWLDFEGIPNQYAESCDVDHDGVLDTDEIAGPNSGDANNDGTQDSEQPNVTSFINSVTGHNTTIEVSDACGLSDLSSMVESTDTKDNLFDYPLGLVNFTANCVDPGFEATVTQYFYDPSVTDGIVLRKFINGEYATLTDATISTETIDGHEVLVVSYTITDGSVLDADGIENGVIVDPVGPAVLAASTPGVPNTGLGHEGTSNFLIAMAETISVGVIEFYIALKLGK